MISGPPSTAIDRPPTVVVLAGLWASSDDWSIVRALLAQLLPGWTVVSINLLGHRKAPGDYGPDAPTPPGELVLTSDDPDDLLSFTAALGRALDAVAVDHDVRLVAAHSYAGRVFIEWAMRHPTLAVNSLLLCPLIDPAQYRAGTRRLIRAGGPVLQGGLLRWLPRALTRGVLAGEYRNLPYPEGVDRFHVQRDRLEADPRVDGLPGKLPPFRPVAAPTRHRFNVLYTMDDTLLDPDAIGDAVGQLRRVGEVVSCLPLKTTRSGHNPHLFAAESVVLHMLRVLRMLGAAPT